MSRSIRVTTIALSALLVAGSLTSGSTGASAFDIGGFAKWMREQQAKKAQTSKASVPLGEAIRRAMCNRPKPDPRCFR